MQAHVKKGMVKMITTDKDFEGLQTNNHPRTYWLKSTDTKPVNKVLNGAVCIEVDTGKGFLFDQESKKWTEV